MKLVKKMVLTALAAMVLLSLAAGAAAALRSLSVSSRIIELLASGLILKGPLNVVCDVGSTITLTNNPIAKTARTNIGTVQFKVLGQETRAERCSRGRARVVGGPFNVNYIQFLGTLPNITGLVLQVLAVTFLATILGIECLITANSQGLQRVVGGVLKELVGTPFTSESIRVVELTRNCPRPEQIGLEGTFLPAGTITVTLI